MKCPYCDDSIHPMAKFCPKCGLPVKEDATVMGAYTTDDTGPNPWIIGGGALGIVVVALSIGWLSSQRNNGGQTVRRETVRYNVPAAQGSVSPGTRMAGTPTPLYGPQMSGYSSFSQFGSPAARPQPSANYQPNVQWAYKPKDKPAVPASTPVIPVVQQPSTPPSNMGILDSFMRERRKPVTVVTLRPNVPELPAQPETVRMAYQPATGDYASSDPFYRSNFPGGGANAAAPWGFQEQQQMARPAGPVGPGNDERADWVWDPVQERWARRSGTPSRTNADRVRSGVPRF